MRGLVLVTSLCLAGLGATADLPAADRPNVLFIAVDDLNHWVGHLARHPQTRTPHIDKLAARGVTFRKAYCGAPACNPSRASLLSGRRPSDTAVYHNSDDFRPRIPASQTLLTTFQNAGYDVLGAGKIYHGGLGRPSEWTATGEKLGRDPQVPAGASDGVGGIKFAPLDCRDEDLEDYRIADWCIDQLQQPRDKPFFLACGFHKPHMPWNVPRKYYDLFPLDSIQLPPTRENDLADIPPAGVKIAGPQGDHAKMLASGRWKEAVQAYLATIAYLDMNVGRLVQALDDSHYRDNTVIVLWGDHGWHLGEKEHWRKFALWEEATRAPLVWVAPGVTKAGGGCDRTVDFLSIYPTLCDLCRIPVPPHVAGPSLRPLLANPAAAWDRPALTTHGYQNHAVRSEKWRYIRYADGSEELYDETADPYEWINLAGNPQHATVKADLARWLPQVNTPPVGKDGEARPKGRGKNKKNTDPSSNR